MNQNNSHLIAGFFRYHREKLNYSLRGLVGDGKVVDLSSLSAFENNKRMLSEQQLIWLFRQIGYDYIAVVNNYSFYKEYNKILELIIFGDTKEAIRLFLKCVNQNVFSSLGVVNFSLLQYFLSGLNSIKIGKDTMCQDLKMYYDNNQLSILKIAESIHVRNDGENAKAIELLNEANNLSFDSKLRAFISQQFGIYYGLQGNYAEATVSLLEAKHRYSELLGFICLIQVNMNLGNLYKLTHSFDKAESSYLEAYQSSKFLKESTYLLTKSFNCLCWLYFGMNQYNKVIDLLKEKPKDLVESRNTYFVLAWGYYKIGNYEEAIKYCHEGLEKFSEYSYVCMVYEYIEKACKGIKTGQDALLRKIIETEDYDNTAEIKELFTYEIIDIYERRKNYEKAFKYAKKLLNR